jgi:hypothetical protein
MGETGSSQGTLPHLLPPVFILLLNDLTRLQRAMGLMTHTRAGLTTRNPQGLVWLEIHGVGRRMSEYGSVTFSYKTGAH